MTLITEWLPASRPLHHKMYFLVGTEREAKDWSNGGGEREADAKQLKRKSIFHQPLLDQAIWGPISEA